MALEKQKVLRHQRVIYIDTAPEGSTHKWELFGSGTNSLTTDMGATIEEDHYITDKNGSSTRTATAKVMTFSGDMIVGDAAQDYILEKAYALGTEAETFIVEVDAWEEKSNGTYKARMSQVLINVTNDGSGDAGSALQVEGELRWVGDPTEGTFNRSTKTFTAGASSLSV